MSDPLPLQPGDPERIGAYQLTGRLGEGGQGVVYTGSGPAGKQVAVKLMRTQVAGDERARDRFVRELAVAERVAGFCTARVLDAEMVGDQPYIVSEYVPGPSLQEFLLAAGPQRGDDLVRLAVGTATALAAIHEAGIVHRDFKPPNVLMGPDGPRVIDFGIARALDTTATLTSQVIGTPAYMAPEQIAAHPVGPYTDMFAWGVTILFAATGVSPFAADSIPAVMHKVLYEQADVSVLPQPLAGLVNACLSKDPARRPSASQALLTLLGQAGTVPQTQMLTRGAAMAATRLAPPAWIPPPASIPQPPPPRRLSGWLALPPVVVAALALGVGNHAIASSYPSLAQTFHASPSSLTWIVNGHLLGTIALVFPASRIADLAGRKLMLIMAAALFTVASILSGLSPVLGMLVVAWSLQGVAAGLLAGASLAVLRAAFPADRMALPVGVWVAAIGLGTGTGPLLYGELASVGNWRLPLFLLAVPGLLVVVLAAALVRESRGERRFPPIELLLPPALTGIAFGISQSPYGWGHPATLLPLLAGAVLLGLYAALARPLLHGLLRSPAVTAGAVLIGVSSLGSYAVILYVSVGLQTVHGMSAVDAFATLLPMAAVSLLVAPLTGLLTERVGARPPLAVGTVLTGVALMALALSGTGPIVAMACMTLAGIGISMVSAAGVTAMSAATAEPLAGVLGGLYQTALVAGSGLGGVLLSEVFSSRFKTGISGGALPGGLNPVTEAYLSGLHTMLWVAAGVVLVSAVFSAFVRPSISAGPPPPPLPGPSGMPGPARTWPAPSQ